MKGSLSCFLFPFPVGWAISSIGKKKGTYGDVLRSPLNFQKSLFFHGVRIRFPIYFTQVYLSEKGRGKNKKEKFSFEFSASCSGRKRGEDRERRNQRFFLPPFSFKANLAASSFWVGPTFFASDCKQEIPPFPPAGRRGKRRRRRRKEMGLKSRFMFACTGKVEEEELKMLRKREEEKGSRK